MIQRPTDAWLDEGNRGLQARLEGGRRSADPPPAPVNADAVLQLGQTLTLPFRGRLYRVDPVPAPEGIRLSVLYDTLERLSPERPSQFAAWEEAYHEITALFHRLVRPRNPIRRLLWNVLPSPFRRISPREVGQLVGFFSVCRALSGVGSLDRAAG